MWSKLLTISISLLLSSSAFSAVKPNDCSDKQKKQINKAHKSVRNALGHIQVIPKVFEGHRLKAETSATKVNGILNSSLGISKGAKSQKAYENYFNLCEAQQNLKKAKKKLNSKKLGKCQMENRQSAVKEIELAMGDLASAISLKKVSCKKK